MSNEGDINYTSGFKLYDKYSDDIYNVDDAMVGLSGSLDFYLYS
jgi:hypothetical protein